MVAWFTLEGGREERCLVFKLCKGPAPSRRTMLQPLGNGLKSRSGVGPSAALLSAARSFGPTSVVLCMHIASRPFDAALMTVSPSPSFGSSGCLFGQCGCACSSSKISKKPASAGARADTARAAARSECGLVET